MALHSKKVARSTKIRRPCVEVAVPSTPCSFSSPARPRGGSGQVTGGGVRGVFKEGWRGADADGYDGNTADGEHGSRRDGGVGGRGGAARF